nr:unnamed protein product [Callosobruchus analis]
MNDLKSHQQDGEILMHAISAKIIALISENIAYSLAAIWTHLRPIFKTLPHGIKRVHFLSDGPLTQYRNKTMFFIMATKLSEEIPDI